MSRPTYTFRPLGPWVEGNTKLRRSSGAFRASWRDTLTLLADELEWLDATNAVIQVDVEEADLRHDGMVRANAKVGHPGVRVAFDSKYGPLTYATDAHEQRYWADPPGWQANVRAIALGLKALRAVDRYGVTRRGEQYKGWKQLPAGSGEAASHMTRDEATALVEALSGAALADFGQSIRRAKAAAHPDRHGGDRALWDQVEQAARALGVGS